MIFFIKKTPITFYCQQLGNRVADFHENRYFGVLLQFIDTLFIFVELGQQQRALINNYARFCVHLKSNSAKNISNKNSF